MRIPNLYYLVILDCLQDIELAFKYKYPKNLQHKLHQRKGSCLTQLGNHTEAKNAFNIAISALDFVPKLAPEKKESMIRDINALMAEAKSTSQRYLTFPWKIWPIQKKTYLNLYRFRNPFFVTWQKLALNSRFHEFGSFNDFLIINKMRIENSFIPMGFLSARIVIVWVSMGFVFSAKFGYLLKP